MDLDNLRAVRATLLISGEELEGEDLDFYDSESRASCGLEDFKDLLMEWQEFVE